MGPVYAETDIDTPREKIEQYLADISTRRDLYGNSVDQFRLVRIDPRGVGAGARFRFTRGRSWIDSTITAIEPGRISERGESGRFNRTRCGTEWEFTETPNGVIRTRVSYWTEPTGAAALFDRITGKAGWHRRRLKAAVRRLREEMESETAPTAETVGVAGGKRFEVGVF